MVLFLFFCTCKDFFLTVCLRLCLCVFVYAITDTCRGQKLWRTPEQVVSCLVWMLEAKLGASMWTVCAPNNTSAIYPVPPFLLNFLIVFYLVCARVVVVRGQLARVVLCFYRMGSRVSQIQVIRCSSKHAKPSCRPQTSVNWKEGRKQSGAVT